MDALGLYLPIPLYLAFQSLHVAFTLCYGVSFVCLLMAYISFCLGAGHYDF